MYIEPNTNIKLLKNVPLDNSYKNTIYFEYDTEQYSYFANFVKYTLTKQTYQRVNKGVARVSIKAESLYDCNYLMFQNESFGSKWFYAFITSVEYVNNTVSEIRFDIDVLQTWLLDCTFKECFVEREHTESDRIGEHTYPENIEHGEYISSTFDGTGMVNVDRKIVVAATVDRNGNDAIGSEYGGIYSGVSLNAFNDVDEVNTYLDEITKSADSDSVVSIFMMPGAFVSETGNTCKSYRITKIKQTEGIGNYPPRNKKLLCYPYNFLYVTNLEGDSAVYQYEHFSSEDCAFTICGDYSCSPSVVLYPINYKGVLANIDEKITITGFPQCSYNIDVYKAWLSQKGPSILANLATGVASAFIPLAFPGKNADLSSAIGGVQLFGTVANTVAQQIEHAIAPPQAKGGNSSNALFAFRMKDFAFMNKHIKEEYARIIDNYFDMFGYAVHKVKVPNRSARPCWNYVKTIGCTIVGGAPADDIAKMCSIHDNGITYWKPNADFGNYTQEDGENKNGVFP